MQRAETITLVIKTFFWSILITLALLFITLLGFSWWSYQQLHKFSQASQTSIPKIINQVKTGWQASQSFQNSRLTILLLGVDTLATRGETKPMTDTIILASVDFASGQIYLLSLPRDLWHPGYQSRINALLAYGQQRQLTQPQLFSQQAISELTAIPIDHTFILTFDQVAALIDIIGGVEIEVKNSFVDEQFPRTDVDVTTETDPKKLYETVEFKTGLELMSGARALTFMRSRHAAGTEGNDNARALRQQQVIEAVMKKLQQPKTLLNPTTLGQLYRWYDLAFSQFLPIPDAIALAIKLIPARRQLQLHRAQLEIYPDSPEGILFHPPLTKYQGQWVYEITDQTKFKAVVKQKLNISQ